MSDLADDDSAQAGEKGRPETDDDILKEARERYQACVSADGDNRTAARDDLLFLSGGENQWDPIDVAARQAQRRPMISVNDLPKFLHQITNEHRQNRLGGKVRPADDGGDDETAEVIQGLIRNIEYDSNATTATMTAVNSAAAIGFGWFRLVTEYESETSFDQKIMFKRIRNALSVKKDPLSQELDGSDSKFYFIDSLESRAEFKRKHPKAEANNTSLLGQDIYHGWLAEDTVLVCEYYRIKETPDTLCLYVDGSTGWKSDNSPVEVEVGPNGKPRERESLRRAVEWFKITGADVLERTVIKCDWIPVFPVYGDEIDIDGKVIRSGIIRNSKDSFKMYNVCITTAIEEVSTRAKSPYIMAEGQDEGHKAQWANINRIPYSAVKYKPVTHEGHLVPPPARSPMADIPAGWLSMTMHFADNKKSTIGIFDASLGAKGTATSGIQEREQQHQGDVANLHFADNLQITYKHALRCIVSMIPHYYDGARMVRILGEDDESEVVPINQPFEQKNPRTKAIETVTRDLTAGRFDVTVSAGPSYSTKRQEAAEFMTDAMQAAKDPAAAAVLTYLAIKNQDVAGGDEAIKLLKKLPPLNAIVDPEEGDEQEPMVQTPQGPMPASKVGALIEQMGQALQNASTELDKGDAAKSQAEALKAQKEINDQQLEPQRLEIEKIKEQASLESAKAAVIKADADLIRAQTEAQIAPVEADMALVNAQASAAQAGQEKVDEAEKAEHSRAQTAQEIAAALEAARPAPPKALSIKAPSGVTYEVTVH